jgi:hypothetical protein
MIVPVTAGGNSGRSGLTNGAPMSENCRGVSRRTVLFAAAGAMPALGLMGGVAQAKMAQAAVHYQADPKDGKQCDGCNFFIAPNGWDGRRRHRPDRLVLALGEQGRFRDGRVPAVTRRRSVAQGD